MLVLREDKNKIAVLGWGRFNPPTKGHQLLGQFVRDKAAEVGGTPMIYSSHTYKNKKDSNGLWGDPLPYEEKAKWLKKVFGDMFIESDLKTVIQILADLYKQGYQELYFIAGSDRIEEYEKMLAYNGQPSKKTGEIPFNFDRVEIIPAGEERNDNASGVASISGTRTRKLAFDGDLEGFKKAVPFSDSDAEELYNTLRTELGAVDESLNEAIPGQTVGSITIKGQTFNLRKTSSTTRKIPFYNMAAGEYKSYNKLKRLFDGSPFDLNIPEFNGEITNYIVDSQAYGTQEFAGDTGHIFVKDENNKSLCNINAIEGGDITYSKDDIRIWVKKYIESLFANSKEVYTAISPHKDEICRIKLVNIHSSTNPEESLLNYLKDTINSINFPVELKSIILLDINVGNPHPAKSVSGADLSGTYSSVDLTISYMAGDSAKEITLYIGLVSKARKVYTPNKVINNMGGKLSCAELTEHIKNINNLPLAKIFSEVVENTHGNPGVDKFLNQKIQRASWESSFDKSLVENINDQSINGLIVDFGEVLGAGSLASIINKDNAQIEFPSGSNAELCDYTIYDGDTGYKVSEKANTGAAPSSTGAITSIYKYIHENQYPSSRAVDFIDWLYNNIVMAKSVHDSYVNLYKLVVGEDTASWYVNGDNSLSKFYSENSLNSHNYKELLNSVGKGNKLDKNKLNDKSYMETARIRYVARIAINSINSDKELIEGFNTLLKDTLGSFIQVYLKASIEDFRNGKLKFEAKSISSNSKYKFIDTSQIKYISKERGYELYTKKLAMVLV